jgi:hypothetical protein
MIGRPTEYKPDYCEMLIAHMESGLSYEAFGGVVRVSKQTLYNWEKAHPEFLDAKNVGKSLERIYWERIARDGLYNETIKDDDGMTVNRSVNSAILIFNLKNRLGWRDKQPDEDAPPPTAPASERYPAMTTEQARALLAAKEKAA